LHQQEAAQSASALDQRVPIGIPQQAGGESASLWYAQWPGCWLLPKLVASSQRFSMILNYFAAKSLPEAGPWWSLTF